MRRWSVVFMLFSVLVTAVALLPMTAAPESSMALAPAPTWTSGPVPTKTPISKPGGPKPPPAGGFIQLEVRFPTTWWRGGIPWQDLWTEVEWLHEKGYWLDVKGWQGGLNSVAAADDGGVIGRQTWWVSQEHLGKGPFRWRLYRKQGSWLMATSQSFYLPENVGETITIELELLWP
jgi:hypothetical protein